MESVDSMEEKIKCPVMERCLVKYLGSIGGKDLKDAAQKIMSRVMTNDLAQKFNRKGMGGKVSFLTLRLNKVVTTAVKLNTMLGEMTKDVTAGACQFWLRYAKDRDGGRKRRTLLKTPYNLNNPSED
ncbi:hypothetical protein LSAT2_016136 [Lamellibrachia satsuma]|nr:hypothetical protein LSAT2_016136 [Lamellibrachia satsuma]